MKAYIETDMEYLERKHQLTNEKLELVYVAIQELQQEFNIPDDNLHLKTAYKYLEEQD